MIQTSLHDFEGHQTYIERFGHLAEINKTFSGVKGWTGPAAFMRECIKVLATKITHT